MERKKIERAQASELVDEDDEVRLRRELEAKRPLPRSSAVCCWKGYDRDGNLYWCNNGVFTHPRTREKHKECAYHVKFCVGLHPTGPVERCSKVTWAQSPAIAGTKVAAVAPEPITITFLPA